MSLLADGVYQGFCDSRASCQCRVRAADMTVTVNAGIDHGQGGQIDHLVPQALLAAALIPGSYSVHSAISATGLATTRVVSAQLDLDRLEG